MPSLQLVLESQVFHAAPVAAHQLQRFDADADVILDVTRLDQRIADGGLHAFGDHRLVGDQQQRARRNPVGETAAKIVAVSMSIAMQRSVRR